MQPIRLYRLDIAPVTGGPTKTRLVRARSSQRAIAHVMSALVKCEPASMDDAYELGRLGVELETASEEGAEPIRDEKKWWHGWSDKETETLHHLYATKVQLGEMAAILGRSRSSVASKAHQLGLVRRRRKTEPVDHDPAGAAPGEV